MTVNKTNYITRYNKAVGLVETPYNLEDNQDLNCSSRRVIQVVIQCSALHR